MDNKSIGVYAAIAKVMAVMASEGIGKSRKNQQQGYNFRGIDDVYNSLARPMVDAGLVVLSCLSVKHITETCLKIAVY